MILDTQLSLSDQPKLLYTFPEYDLFVLYKPAHILSHSDGRDIRDLLTWSTQQSTLPAKLSLIHRLDLQTSGLVCASATVQGAKYWGQIWAQQQVNKRYIALVHGKTRTKGVIKRALKDGRRGRPLEAETRYRTLLHLDHCSLLEIKIIGGRKHQIRKHLQGISHPILGDTRYASANHIKRHQAPRLCLHAIQLDLTTPLSPLYEASSQQNTKPTYHRHTIHHTHTTPSKSLNLFCPLASDFMDYLQQKATTELLQLQKVRNALAIKNP